MHHDISIVIHIMPPTLAILGQVLERYKCREFKYRRDHPFPSVLSLHKDKETDCCDEPHYS